MATLIAHNDFLFVSNGLKFIVMDFKRKTQNYRRCLSSFRPKLSNSSLTSEYEKSAYSNYIKSLKKPYSGQIDSINMHGALQNIMTPFHSIPYDEELGFKLIKNKEAVGKLLRKDDSFQYARSVLSPGHRLNQYRNQDEFSIGVGVDGNTKTVGFFVKVLGKNKVICVPPTEIMVIKDKHKQICSLYENVIRQSPLSAYHQARNPNGFWSDISVRTNSQEESFVTVKVNGEADKKSVEDLKDSFLNIVSRLSMKQVFSKDTTATIIDNGEDLHETINGIKLRISQETNYFSNTAMMKELYNEIFKGLRFISKDSVLLDLNCGCGFSSISASSHCNTVIGFDKNVNDALYNAEMNGVQDQTSFFHGDLKITIPRFFEIASDSMIANKPVYVLIHSRESIGYEVFECFRKCPHIERVVYVTSVPEKQPLFDFINMIKFRFNSMMKNSVNYTPFKFCYATPIDLYPSTRHCEHIFVFRR
nr:tRNA (uracil(54)-C(5))-methyltransferase homolog isoform X2 [Lepeophtheirus salmonis]